MWTCNKHRRAEKLELQGLPFPDTQFCPRQKFGKTDALLECRLPTTAEQLNNAQMHPFVFTNILQTLEMLQKEDSLSPCLLTSKLNIHKDFDKRLGQLRSVLVRAEYSLAMKHTRDERVLGLI